MWVGEGFREQENMEAGSVAMLRGHNGKMKSRKNNKYLWQCFLQERERRERNREVEKQ